VTPNRADQRAAGRGGAPPFETVQALSDMIKDLERQLDRVIGINDALEKDLEAERKRRGDLERRVEDMLAELRNAEAEAARREDLLAEINQLNDERSQLARTVEDLGQKLARAEKEREKHESQSDRLRAGRADALDELQSVEAQFERAMRVVTDLKTRLSVTSEECDALRGRLKVLEEQSHRTESERDSLLTEVEESRAALEEIRRSLVDACVVSEHRWRDEAEG